MRLIVSSASLRRAGKSMSANVLMSAAVLTSRRLTANPRQAHE